jgi:predicted glycoside hydrolase/deacetylase ChbG (UPF0249 family)
MMKYLIVSADDFGLTKSVNEGIAMACREGIVTSVKLFPSGEAFADALGLARELGLKEAGAHLALTETSPVAPADKVVSLRARNGRFYRSRAHLIPRLMTGLIDPDHVYTELKAQMDAVVSSGLRVTDLSSHEHIHMMPEILAIFVKLAKEYDVPAIRYPHKDSSARPLGLNSIYKSFVLACFERGMSKVLSASSIKSPDHFRGFLDSANITEANLLRIVDFLEEGSTELVCHPGFLGPEILDRYTFHRNCEAELFALTSPRVRKRLEERGIRLASYSEFLSGGI